MDFNIESNFLNKMIRNQFDILNIEENNNIYLYYLDKNLLYVKITSKNNGWEDDIKIRIYSIDKTKYEDLSIGGSYYSTKEMEFYLDIDLEYNEQIIRKYIPNNVIINKNLDNNLKKEYYENIKFRYFNNFYLFNNDIKIINDFIDTNYDKIKNTLEYIINSNIKLTIYILLYLNKNGGIFINHNVKNICIDYNIDDNLCYINNNFISIIFTKINFLNEELLLDDLCQKRKIDFSKYLNNFVFKNDESIICKKINNNTYDYYTDIYILTKYTFYILSKKNITYNIEELQGNYYCLTSILEFEKDLIIEICDNESKNKFLFEEIFIKNRFDNNLIFKI